jgi:hypothetical protein
VLATAVGRDFKARVSVVIYVIAWAAFGLYVPVAVMGLVPDRRIEKTLAQ